MTIVQIICRHSNVRSRKNEIKKYFENIETFIDYSNKTILKLTSIA